MGSFSRKSAMISVQGKLVLIFLVPIVSTLMQSSYSLRNTIEEVSRLSNLNFNQQKKLSFSSIKPQAFRDSELQLISARTRRSDQKARELTNQHLSLKRDSPRPNLRWQQIQSALAKDLTMEANDFRRFMNKILLKSNISSACSTSLNTLADSLDQQQLWATQTLYSSARHLPSGIFDGVFTELGHFDLCLSTKYPLGIEGLHDARLITGQYCSVIIKPPVVDIIRTHKHQTICSIRQQQDRLLSTYNTEPRPNDTVPFFVRRNQQFQYVGLRLGLCTPSSCARWELQQLLNIFLTEYQLTGLVRSCQSSASIGHNSFWSRLDAEQLGVILAILTLIGLCIISTAVENFISTSSAKNKTEDQLATKLRNNRTSTRLRNKRVLVDDKDRWHYQVYRIDGNLNAVDEFSHFHSVSMDKQKNPLHRPEEFKPSGTEDQSQEYEVTHADNSNPIEMEKEPWLHTVLSKEANKIESSHGSSKCLGSDSSEDSVHAQTFLSILVCFSLFRNIRYIFKMHGRDNDHDQLRAIHGIKTLAMAWIIFGESMTISSSDILNNIFQLADIGCGSRLFQALLNSSLVIDTFFMLSGVLTILSLVRRSRGVPVAFELTPEFLTNQRSSKPPDGRTRAAFYMITENSESSCPLDLLPSFPTTGSSSPFSSSDSSNHNLTADTKARAKSKHGSINSDSSSDQLRIFRPLLWLAMRYLRLSPTYGVVIGLAIVLPVLGSGPFWLEAMSKLGPSNCRSKWWLNLLYINNHVQPEKLCLQHSWYLSNSVQFYIVTILIFSLYFYSFKQLTLLVWISLFASSTAITFAITSIHEFPPSLLPTSPMNQPERLIYKHTLFNKPWPHLPSYLIGLLAGYSILSANKHETKPISPIWRTLAWIFTLLIGLSLVNSLYPWNMGLEMDTTLSALHASTFRSLWSICNALLVYELTFHGRMPLSRLLGWSGFQVPSRLTYCAYLLHPLVIQFQIGQLRERPGVSATSCLSQFLGTWVLTYLSAMILSLIIEVPSIQLQRLVNSRVSHLDRKNIMKARVGNGSSHSGKGNHQQRPKQHNLSFDSDWSMGSSSHEKTLGGSKSANTSSKLGTNGKRQTRVRLAEFPVSLRAKETKPKFILREHNLYSKSTEPDLNSAAVETRNTSPQRSIKIPPNKPLDADFQKKLAQAVGRGFKLRNKMAMAGVVTTTNSTDSASSFSLGTDIGKPADRSWTSRRHESSSRVSKDGSCLRTFVAVDLENSGPRRHSGE